MKGHIRARGRGTWAIVLDIGQDEKGERRQKWHTVHGTKKDAEREMTRLIRELDTGSYVEPSRTTVADYLEQWLVDYARSNVSAKTCQEYAQKIRCHLIPSLGKYPLEKLTPMHIQSFYSRSLENGRRDGKGGLAPLTVLHMHRILHKALDQAVRWQLLARNPVDAVEPPKARAHEMKVLDREQIDKLLRVALGTRYYLPVVLAITTGMRRGEIMALRWDDIDLERGTLSVRRSLEQTVEGLRFKEPKTAKSRRVIALPRTLTDALRQHKSCQAEQRLLMGEGYVYQGLVYASEDGSPVNPDSISDNFVYLLRRAGLPHIRFHDLRHTHATMLLTEGVHPKVVSERLGHSSIGITLDTYSHVLPSMQEEAARKIDDYLGAAPSANR